MRRGHGFAVLAGSLLLLASCSEAPEPTAPGDGGAAPRFSAVQGRSGAPDRRELARQVPGFGGIYFDDDGVLTVQLTEPGARGAAQRALAAFMREHGNAPEQLRVRQAAFAYTSLAAWAERAVPEAFEAGRVVLGGVNEKRNRVVIGVEDAASIGPVRSAIARLGLPAEAFDVEVRAPIRNLATLQDKATPIIGGYQIHFPGFLCTLGFGALSGSEESFITNSHCTINQGGVDNTTYWQPLSTVDNTVIATEVADPLYGSLPGCPPGYQCRYADASRARLTGARALERGKIAKTQALGSLNVVGAYTITGEYSQSGVGQNCPVIGTTLNKVGRTTGWSQGKVTDTCIAVGVSGTNKADLYQVIVAANVNSGDSGSPVFRIDSGDNVTLYGILWGGGTGVFVYSPLVNIEQELGPLTVTGSGGSTEPPPAPTGLAATAVSTSEIDLTWDDVSGETGYIVERCTGASCSNFAQVGTTGQNQKWFTNPGLSASTTYRYRVAGTNSGGTGGFSNIASATTQAGQAPSYTLTVGNGSKSRGTWSVPLSWTPSTPSVDVYANGTKIASNIGTGGFTHQFKGSGTFTYQVCSAGGTSNCSDPVTKSF